MDFLLTIPGSLGVFPPSPAIRVTWNSRESQTSPKSPNCRNISNLCRSSSAPEGGWPRVGTPGNWKIPVFPQNSRLEQEQSLGWGWELTLNPAQANSRGFFFFFSLMSRSQLSSPTGIWNSANEGRIPQNLDLLPVIFLGSLNSNTTTNSEQIPQLPPCPGNFGPKKIPIPSSMPGLAWKAEQEKGMKEPPGSCSRPR